MFHSFPKFRKRKKQKFSLKISLKENSPYWHSQVTFWTQGFVKKLVTVKPIMVLFIFREHFNVITLIYNWGKP